MAKERRPAEELSVEELEAILSRKRLEAREERLRQFQRNGRTVRLRADPIPISHVDDLRAEVEPYPAGADGTERWGVRRKIRSGVNQFLLLVEIGAVLGLAFVLFSFLDIRQALNQEVAAAWENAQPTATPLISAVVLPSGHTPPTSPGGPRPNEAEIPANLRPLVQSMPALPIPTASLEQAQKIFIPALWENPAPVVQGDGWEQLKKGVGQHIGSADPGQPGNVVLSAHNDIFGELFRELDQLRAGDEVIVSTATKEYVYRVIGWRIIEPTEVSVMQPTIKPSITLISCYPYLVDNQRIVVFGELAES